MKTCIALLLIFVSGRSEPRLAAAEVPANGITPPAKPASVWSAVYATGLWAWLCLWPLTGAAQLQVLPQNEPARVFSGEVRPIQVVLHNAGSQAVKADLRACLYLASSATVMPLGTTPWKQLELLPGQTLIDSISPSFPAVKAETRFLIQWLEGTNRVPGVTEALVYPADLLKDLRLPAGNGPVGVLDPSNQVKPLLKAVSVAFLDLEDAGLDHFAGKLALIGPFQSRTQMRAGLAAPLKALAGRGAGVVWIQPPPEPRARPVPSFYIVSEGKGAIVIVQAGLVRNLSEDPRSQLNLIHYSRLALHPEPFDLPESNQTR